MCVFILKASVFYKLRQNPCIYFLLANLTDFKTKKNMTIKSILAAIKRVSQQNSSNLVL